MTGRSGSPLVSCIMPTANRRAFVPHAIAYFERQDYPNKELIILDDGADSVADLIPGDPAIQYTRIANTHPLGTKRNLCVEAAHGDLIMHWDDDDWMSPTRISLQVSAMLAADAEICGLRRMLFHNRATAETWLFDYPETSAPWLAGGSLLYTRDFWRKSPFPHVQVGEDARFVWSRRLERYVAMPEYRFYVATIHDGNTSPKICEGPFWRRSTDDLRAILGPDFDSYCRQQAAPPSPGGKLMRLNLGCCDAPVPGFLNVDRAQCPGVDQLADLSQPWPWPDNSVEAIRAWDIIEHLPDKIQTMNEMWRVLVPGGRTEIAVPTTDGPGAFQDPTHVSFWNRRSFLYYEAGNPYRERFTAAYGIRAKFRIVSEHTTHSMDGPRLTIVLEAVKP